MRACGFVCLVFVIFLLIDQFYTGLDYFRLFIGGLVAVALWTDLEPYVRRRWRRRIAGRQSYSSRTKEKE